MRVAMYTNASAWRSRSMTLYAHRLQTAVAAIDGHKDERIDATVIHPWTDIETGTPLDKPLYYLNRLALIPAQMRLSLAGFDLVHIVDHAAAELARNSNLPSVVTVHDLIPVKMREGAFGDESSARISRPAWWLFRRALQSLLRADALICVSESTAHDVMRHTDVPSERVHVIPQGIDEHFFAAEPRRRPAGGAAPFWLLSVGHAHAYKNLPRLVDAWLRVRSRGIDVRLRRIGPLPEELLRSIRQAQAETSLSHAGGVDPVALAREYAKADLLCMPSLYEGFGWPPLEAMAGGTPALCSRAGALSETAGPAALIENPLDTEEIAHWIGRFVSDIDLYNSVAAEGHTHAQRYRWTTTAKATAEVYRSLA